MAKWKLFNRSKGKEETPKKVETTTEHIGESEQKPMKPETKEESEEIPVKVYNETLYSKGSVHKQPATTLPEKKPLLKRTSWESPGTIEHNVDDMGHKQTELPGTQTQTSSDTDKKVDFILLKKKVRR